MKQATYRIVFFEAVQKYIGIAWNYDEAILIATKACQSYDGARLALEYDTRDAGVELRWFDGEYSIAKGQELMVPRKVQH